QKQKKLIMLPSETMIWQPEFTDKILSRKPGAVQDDGNRLSVFLSVVPSLPSLKFCLIVTFRQIAMCGHIILNQ
ncbi:hypothetical protein B9P94_09545, partial [Escherichia coli]